MEASLAWVWAGTAAPRARGRAATEMKMLFKATMLAVGGVVDEVDVLFDRRVASARVVLALVDDDVDDEDERLQCASDVDVFIPTIIEVIAQPSLHLHEMSMGIDPSISGLQPQSQQRFSWHSDPQFFHREC